MKQMRLQLELPQSLMKKLIFDVLNNDSTNYSHWHEVRASWQLIDRIEKLWAENGAPLYEYKSGSMGPTASDDLLAEYGAEWVWKPEPKN